MWSWKDSIPDGTGPAPMHATPACSAVAKDPSQPYNLSYFSCRKHLKYLLLRCDLEVHLLSGRRMPEGQFCRTQRQLCRRICHLLLPHLCVPFPLGIIFPVAKERKSCMRHLYPDLVVPPGIKMDFSEGILQAVWFCTLHRVCAAGIFTCHKPKRKPRFLCILLPFLYDR